MSSKTMSNSDRMDSVALAKVNKFVNTIDDKLYTLKNIITKEEKQRSTIPTTKKKNSPSIKQLKKYCDFLKNTKQEFNKKNIVVSNAAIKNDNTKSSKKTKRRKATFSSSQETLTDSTGGTDSDTCGDKGESMVKFSDIWNSYYGDNSTAKSTDAKLLINPSSSSSLSSTNTLVSDDSDTPTPPSSSTATDDEAKLSESENVLNDVITANLLYRDCIGLGDVEDNESVWEVINYYNYEGACSLGAHRHLHYYELPFPWRENRYIIHGYRFFTDYKNCLKSVLGLIPITSYEQIYEPKTCYNWHNETVNIWTHLSGAIYLLYMLVRFQIENSSSIPWPINVAVSSFLLSGISCFLLSVTWHTFNGFSILPWRSRACCCDYTGITLLITTSIISMQFTTLYSGSNESSSTPYGLYCFSLLSFILGSASIFMNWSPKFDRPESRILRILAYVFLASSGNLSFLISDPSGGSHFKLTFFSSLIWYLVGVVFYAGFDPEKHRTDVLYDKNIPTHRQLSNDITLITNKKHHHFRKKPLENINHGALWKSFWWCDYYLQSHNIWHTFVVLGCLGHFNALLTILKERGYI
ncbi:uncharacterized protein SCODWIG_00387 [Saccharomycodes ludwigii]|uniref:ADIPOR-like receptor IZH3 n=1 Tax=Saccharomycodes ludwigii TaxID=36035 RepID=A0A376B1R3_9ASCO|nr:hypothetical protein SCDLUD_004796 [Saccharomycodes ludwigii]KAH3899356.1 hypothetical protein SCDLUD_004796 [Saccharomycodes ludwigii]SSD58626.1 uncharacterized protein SCODWIG_00387 [Saccharomycodes ludwigii]